ncbi:MAG: hypothetical protein E6K63_08630 [Nitrospirae bacterium]|nr:MAG: hypothetical protein E6K63_08630 [Nitrospirota bacterium]
MDIEIGSNLYRNTDGTVEVEGVPQLTVSIRKPEGPLMVNFVVFDEGGRVCAKLVDSTMSFNERRAHELTRTPSSLMLKHTESDTIVLEIALKAPDRVLVKHGAFLTMKGHLLEISPTEWRVQKRRMSGGDDDVHGGAVTIG